jgi:hypothetical protein
MEMRLKWKKKLCRSWRSASQRASLFACQFVTQNLLTVSSLGGIENRGREATFIIFKRLIPEFDHVYCIGYLASAGTGESRNKDNNDKKQKNIAKREGIKDRNQRLEMQNGHKNQLQREEEEEEEEKEKEKEKEEEEEEEEEEEKDKSAT